MHFQLVTTTYVRLNRYRVGDVLQVTGFHNSALQFQFMCRKNMLLSIKSDKTDEAELQCIMEHVSAALPVGRRCGRVHQQGLHQEHPQPLRHLWELLTKGPEPPATAAMEGLVQ